MTGKRCKSLECMHDLVVSLSLYLPNKKNFDSIELDTIGRKKPLREENLILIMPVSAGTNVASYRCF